jgi:hypothetical protein
MRVRGQFAIRTTIVIENEPMEQVAHFSYVGCDVTCGTNSDIVMKLNNFRHIGGTLKKQPWRTKPAKKHV